MKLLLFAGPASRPLLERHLAADFALEWVEDPARAVELLGREAVEGVVIHLDVGEEQALDVVSHCRRLAPERAPGLIAVARSPALRTVIELMRTGAYDVLVEEELKPRELPHAVRNAVYFAKSAAWLATKKRAQAAGEVWVVGGGDAGEAAAMLLGADGTAVRRFATLEDALAAGGAARAVLLDLSAAADGAALARLIRPG
jgi:DNA-binding NtrC family response regulator